MSKCPIKIDEPRYDQSTYVGRAKHFIETTNPLNVLVGSARLEEAKELVRRCRAGEPLPAGVTEAQLWRAKALFESAFHPDTGERMTLIGRMSAQVPMNMVITGGMVAFYRSTAAVVFWQWLNQSFNAVVNYTNRSGDQPQSDRQLAASYVCATGGAVGTALYLNSLVKRMPPLVGRFVPLVAVAAANCINIPMMRVNELREGTPVYDESNAKLGYSRAAARSGIVQVTFSRICMATPGMVVTPLVMSRLERGALLRRHPRLALPVTVAVMGVCLTFATPLACAFFQQRAAIRFDRLEPELQEAIKKNRPNVPVPDLVYFNKGL